MTAYEEMKEAERAWDALNTSGHGNCEGWTRDSRDPAGQVTCSCGAVITVGETC